MRSAKGSLAKGADIEIGKSLSAELQNHRRDTVRAPIRLASEGLKGRSLFACRRRKESPNARLTLFRSPTREKKFTFGIANKFCCLLMIFFRPNDILSNERPDIAPESRLLVCAFNRSRSRDRHSQPTGENRCFRIREQNLYRIERARL